MPCGRPTVTQYILVHCHIGTNTWCMCKLNVRDVCYHTCKDTVSAYLACTCLIWLPWNNCILLCMRISRTNDTRDHDGDSTQSGHSLIIFISYSIFGKASVVGDTPSLQIYSTPTTFVKKLRAVLLV